MTRRTVAASLLGFIGGSILTTIVLISVDRSSDVRLAHIERFTDARKGRVDDLYRLSIDSGERREELEVWIGRDGAGSISRATVGRSMGSKGRTASFDLMGDPSFIFPVGGSEWRVWDRDGDGSMETCLPFSGPAAEKNPRAAWHMTDRGTIETVER